MKNPMIVAFEKTSKAIKEGQVTRAEIEKQAKKNPKCFAARYLQWEAT